VAKEPEWIGVDLDGTVAYYENGGFKTNGPLHIGAPIKKMVDRVRTWLDAGEEVRIFTARVAEEDPVIRAQIIDAIELWCAEHIGRVLPITNIKDMHMKAIYDDRAFQVRQNTGIVVGEDE
jgi:hypothetical protein